MTNDLLANCLPDAESGSAAVEPSTARTLAVAAVRTAPLVDVELADLESKGKFGG